jgi:hypothetical protein
MAPRSTGGEPVFLKTMKLLEHHIQKTIGRLQSQPLLLILVAMFFMNGMMKQVKRRLPNWAIQSL